MTGGGGAALSWRRAATMGPSPHGMSPSLSTPRPVVLPSLRSASGHSPTTEQIEEMEAQEALLRLKQLEEDERALERKLREMPITHLWLDEPDEIDFSKDPFADDPVASAPSVPSAVAAPSAVAVPAAPSVPAAVATVVPASRSTARSTAAPPAREEDASSDRAPVAWRTPDRAAERAPVAIMARPAGGARLEGAPQAADLPSRRGAAPPRSAAPREHAPPPPRDVTERKIVRHITVRLSPADEPTVVPVHMMQRLQPSLS